MNLGGVRWVTFDCYGTLIDWETGILSVVRPLAPGVDDSAILAAYSRLERAVQSGPYLTYRDVLSRVMAGLAETFGIPTGGPQLDALADSLGSWPAFAETPAALAALQRRFKLAVISNIDDDLFRGSAPRLGVTLDAFISAQQCRSYKPSLRNFRVAMERTAAVPGEILHVAESLYHDIAPARELGIRTAWVNRRPGGAGASGTAPTRPDLEVRSLTELVARLVGTA